MKDDGDYSIHSVDPDVLVDWDAIELIVCVFANLIHVYYKQRKILHKMLRSIKLS